MDQRPRNRPYSPIVCAGAGIRLPHGRGEFLNSLSSVRTTMTFRSDGKATLRSPLPDEVAFESLASRLRPFTVDTDDLFYGKAFDALDQLLAAPKHDKFRRISQAVHQDWRTATDRTSRTRAYRISSEAAQHADVDLAFSWLHGDLVLRASRGCSVISVVTCGVTRRDQLIRLARSTPHSKGVQNDNCRRSCQRARRLWAPTRSPAERRTCTRISSLSVSNRFGASTNNKRLPLDMFFGGFLAKRSAAQRGSRRSKSVLTGSSALVIVLIRKWW